MKPFDLSSYKKIAEDDKTVTMSHPKGHKITIVLKALPKIQREQLKRIKMDDGGQVQTSGGLSQEQAQGMIKGAQEGGVEHPVEQSAANKAAEDEARFARGGMAHYDEGTPDEPVSQDDTQDDTSAPNQSHTTNVIVNTPQQPTQPPTPPQAMSAMAPNGQVVAPAPAPVNVPNVAPGAPNVTQGGEFIPANTAKNAQQVIGEQGQIAAEGEKAKQYYSTEQAKQDQMAANQYINNVNDMKQHVQDFDTALQNIDISPKHYSENMSAPRKVAAAIGLFLGGFKQGLVGGNNPAMDFMNQQIDRDIAAQKQKAENVKTIFGAYKQLYGDENVATNLTRATMNNMLTRQAEATAAQLGSAQAMAAAKALAAQKAAENNKLYLDSAGLLQNTPNAGNGEALPPQAANAPEEKKGQAQSKSEQDFEDIKTPILSPDSEKKMANVQYNRQLQPFAKDISEQHAAAAKADFAISKINEIMPRIVQTANNPSGYLMRKATNLSGVPYIGPMAEGVGNLVGDLGATQENREYNADWKAVESYVKQALPNASSDFVSHILAASAPEEGDSPTVMRAKWRNLVDKVKTAITTDKIDMAKMTSKSMKKH